MSKTSKRRLIPISETFCTLASNIRHLKWNKRPVLWSSMPPGDKLNEAARIGGMRA